VHLSQGNAFRVFSFWLLSDSFVEHSQQSECRHFFSRTDLLFRNISKLWMIDVQLTNLLTDWLLNNEKKQQQIRILSQSAARLLNICVVCTKFTNVIWKCFDFYYLSLSFSIFVVDVLVRTHKRTHRLTTFCNRRCVCPRSLLKRVFFSKFSIERSLLFHLDCSLPTICLFICLPRRFH